MLVPAGWSRAVRVAASLALPPQADTTGIGVIPEGPANRLALANCSVASQFEKGPWVWSGPALRVWSRVLSAMGPLRAGYNVALPSAG
jgi:hypothetical protein